MYPVCYICLRGNVELKTLEQNEIVDLYDDLCDLNDYYNSVSYQFCLVCICKLKKFRDFKLQCNLAKDTLKSWRKIKKSKRPSIFDLYKKMPPSDLSVSNRKNFKVYFYQSSDTNTPPIQMSSFHPHIITVNIPGDNMDIKQEMYEVKNVEENISLNLKVFAEEGSCENFVCDKKIKVEFTDEDSNSTSDSDSGSNYGKSGSNDDKSGSNDDKSGSNDDKSGSNDSTDDDDDVDSINDEVKGLHDPLSNDELESDSDKSLQDLITYLKKLPTIKAEKRGRKRSKSKENITNERLGVLEKLKRMLRQKFNKTGEIMDDKGNLVDFEKFINGFEKMPLNYLRICAKNIYGEKVLKYSIIKELSNIQTQFIEFAAVFDIEYLVDTTQARAEFAKRSEYPEYVNAEHRCETCLRGFQSLKSLDFHNRAQHNQSLPIVCELCKMRFKDNKNLSRHWTQVHSTIFKCKKCPYIVAHKDGMENHFRKHVGLKYTCQHCPNTEFNRRNQWYFHMNKYHKVKESLVHCEFCAYYTHSSAGLILHKNRMHYGEQFIESEHNKNCEECNVNFISEDVYYKHMQISHRTSAHTRKPRTSAKYVKHCNMCTATGYGASWLKEHYAEQHPEENFELVFQKINKFLCDFCGKGYQHKSALEAHITVHSDTRPFVCHHNECNRAFPSQKKMLLHMDRHLPPRHICDECGKKFRSRSNLRNHILTHKGDRCHKCEHCGKGFISKALLNEHVRGVHLNIRRKRKRDTI